MMTVTDPHILSKTKLINSSHNPEVVMIALKKLIPLLSEQDSRCILAFAQGLVGQKKAASYPQPTKAK